MTNEIKDEGVCPKCGEWNYEPPFIIVQNKVDINDNIFRSAYSVTDYKCIKCGTVWHERWDIDDNKRIVTNKRRGCDL